MKYIYTLFLLFIIVSTVNSQNFQPKFKVCSEGTSSNDFEFLKDEIKDARVVMLGEISHYDGNIIATKGRIAEYLITEMGFTTIAFESGMYDLYAAQQEIDHGANVAEAFRKSLFSVWGKRKEFQDFVQFFENRRDVLKVVGFDHQITGVHGNENLVNALQDFCHKHDIKLKLNTDDFILLLESISRSGLFDEADISYDEFELKLKKLVAKITTLTDSEEVFYWKQIVRGLLTLGKDAKNRELLLSSFNTTANDNIRDAQMAENLLAYLEAHPDEKVICWGANQHFANNVSSVEKTALANFVPMGSYVKSKLKDDVFSLACVTAEDSLYIQGKWNKTPIKKNSFESFLKNTKASMVYVSGHQKAMDTMVAQRLFSPVTFVEANLSELHDGYLYFDKSVPSTPIKDSVVTVVAPEENTSKDLVRGEKDFDTIMPATWLEEVVIYEKRTAYQVMREAINRIPENYPKNSFGSYLYATSTMKVDDTLVLDYEFTASQFDRGYVNSSNRNTVNIEEVHYKKDVEFKPANLRSYYGFAYVNPIQYAPILEARKFKKMDIYIIKKDSLWGREVYKIEFSSPRNHATYTGRTFESKYSGYVYITTDDYAFLKIDERWDVTNFPDHFKEGYAFKKELKAYTSKMYTVEQSSTRFKKYQGVYYIADVENRVEGNVKNEAGDIKNFTLSIQGTWSKFNVGEDKISYRKEQTLFDKVKFHKDFWDHYKRPNIVLE
ncbi:erythromycin esterase family protein [Neptunitalea lumnitzerae]|uniref:Erythromycin esterase n=1 Tax=Neptunitalea lumnitzerae TaxID=2965509 RepID=A0ABQ5MFY9_9FLAO|nr:erythromycin esterase family protein [Neptunitalea sp. Y10]GLB47817.1 hypothetical protein Y10_01850 [Neptunitalea sp. Y10]